MTRRILPRRQFLGAAGVAAAGALSLTLVPFGAEATPSQVSAAIEKVIGNKTANEGRVNITLPEIAENGGVVPMKVAVESPMTAGDHVKAVHLFADGNPLPEIANYHFGPHNGKADFALRIRLAKTQKIVAVAEMSDGRVFIARREVKVTLGGCGG